MGRAKGRDAFGTNSKNPKRRGQLKGTTTPPRRDTGWRRGCVARKVYHVKYFIALSEDPLA